MAALSIPIFTRIPKLHLAQSGIAGQTNPTLAGRENTLGREKGGKSSALLDTTLSSAFSTCILQNHLAPLILHGHLQAPSNSPCSPIDHDIHSFIAYPVGIIGKNRQNTPQRTKLARLICLVSPIMETAWPRRSRRKKWREFFF